MNFLWDVDHFHFAVALAMKNFHLSFFVAEYEHIAITELTFFHGLFKSHGAQRE